MITRSASFLLIAVLTLTFAPCVCADEIVITRPVLDENKRTVASYQAGASFNVEGFVTGTTNLDTYHVHIDMEDANGNNLHNSSPVDINQANGFTYTINPLPGPGPGQTAEYKVIVTLHTPSHGETTLSYEFTLRVYQSGPPS